MDLLAEVEHLPVNRSTFHELPLMPQRNAKGSETLRAEDSKTDKTFPAVLHEPSLRIAQ